MLNAVKLKLRGLGRDSYYQKLVTLSDSLGSGTGEVFNFVGEFNATKKLRSTTQLITAYQTIATKIKPALAEKHAKTFVSALKNLFNKKIIKEQPSSRFINIVARLYGTAARQPALIKVDRRREIETIYKQLQSGIILESYISMAKKSNMQKQLGIYKFLAGKITQAHTDQQIKLFINALKKLASTVTKTLNKSFNINLKRTFVNVIDAAKRNYRLNKQNRDLTRMIDDLNKQALKKKQNAEKQLAQAQRKIPQEKRNLQLAQQKLRTAKGKTGRWNANRKIKNAQKNIRKYEAQIRQAQQDIVNANRALAR